MDHPLPDLNDQAVFERVWRRVMPQDRPDSPIQLLSDLPAPSPAQPPAPLAVPSASTPVVEEQDVPLLGASSAVYGPLLQRCIELEMVSFRTYRALSRRMPGPSAKLLASMAAEERRHARRLSAAYFLISGVRYLPPEPSQGADRMEPAPAGVLRRRFAEEQRSETLYRAAAAECSDPCLSALFQSLAQEEAAHRDLILTLLEGTF